MLSKERAKKGKYGEQNDRGRNYKGDGAMIIVQLSPIGNKLNILEFSQLSKSGKNARLAQLVER